jgi:hypothetical protein
MPAFKPAPVAPQQAIFNQMYGSKPAAAPVNTPTVVPRQATPAPAPAAPAQKLTAPGGYSTSFNAAYNALKPGAKMKKGGKVASASKRADGIAKQGKTRGKMI